MSTFGKNLIESAKQALEIAAGTREAASVHVPRPSPAATPPKVVALVPKKAG